MVYDIGHVSFSLCLHCQLLFFFILLYCSLSFPLLAVLSLFSFSERQHKITHKNVSLTLSLPGVIIIGFCKQHRSKQDGSSHLDLRCLTFSFSTLHINFFPIDSLFKTKADDK